MKKTSITDRKDEEFPLRIEHTGVIKHITINLILDWEEKGEGEKLSMDVGEKYDPDADDNRSKIVLKDGVVEWMIANLEKNVYIRGLDHPGPSRPELVFGTESDRASFVLKWL